MVPLFHAFLNVFLSVRAAAVYFAYVSGRGRKDTFMVADQKFKLVNCFMLSLKFLVRGPFFIAYS
jgi:hypothetical protein